MIASLTTTPGPLPESDDPALPVRDIVTDQAFIDLLQAAEISLIAALHPALIVCFGARDNTLTISATRMPPALGIATDGSRLAIGSRRDITVFAPSTRLAEHLPGREARHDVVYVPVNTYRTGECMTHEMVLHGPSVVFTNTQFSCLARADGLANFVPLWKPPFISTLMPEDRCHLNSFAIDGGRVRYATAFAASDAPAGYRQMPNDGGMIIDVEANAVVVTGLTKPHSVRIFDDKLYVLNSGVGEVLLVDLAARRQETLATLPGFTRGLREHGGILYVGLSTLRPSAQGLNLPLSARADSLFAGIAALDAGSGRLLGLLRLPPGVTELLDFVVIPGYTRPLVMDPGPDAASIGIETPTGSYWMAAGRDPRQAVAPGA